MVTAMAELGKSNAFQEASLALETSQSDGMTTDLDLVGNPLLDKLAPPSDPVAVLALTDEDLHSARLDTPALQSDLAAVSPAAPFTPEASLTDGDLLATGFDTPASGSDVAAVLLSMTVPEESLTDGDLNATGRGTLGSGSDVVAVLPPAPCTPETSLTDWDLTPEASFHNKQEPEGSIHCSYRFWASMWARRRVAGPGTSPKKLVRAATSLQGSPAVRKTTEKGEAAKSRAPVSTPRTLIFDGTYSSTKNGLTADDLKLNRQGLVVSKRRSEGAKMRVLAADHPFKQWSAARRIVLAEQGLPANTIVGGKSSEGARLKKLVAERLIKMRG